MGSAASNTWWDRIIATNGDCARVLALSKDFAKGRATHGMFSKWTIFDHVKADFAVKILAHASTCLRVRASALIDHGISRSEPPGMTSPSAFTSSGLIAIEFESVIDAFCSCSEILFSRARMSALESDDQISIFLACITENLVCFVHDMVVCSTTDEDLENLASTLDNYFRLAENYAQGSLVFKVAYITQERLRRWKIDTRRT